MGAGYVPDTHQATFETAGGISYICTVPNAASAKEKARELAAMGVGCIELCGAFGPELAREIIDITGGGVAVGYIVYDADQDPLFERFFG